MQRMQCFIFMVCWVKKGSTSWVARAGRAAASWYTPRPIHRNNLHTQHYDEDHAARFFFRKIFLAVAAHIA